MLISWCDNPDLNFLEASKHLKMTYGCCWVMRLSLSDTGTHRLLTALHINTHWHHIKTANTQWMTVQMAYVQTVALCLCLWRDVIYKVILTLNIPATLHADTHTTQPPHSMKYKINTVLSNKQQKQNSGFHFQSFNDTRETRMTLWPTAKTENKNRKGFLFKLY